MSKKLIESDRTATSIFFIENRFRILGIIVVLIAALISNFLSMGGEVEGMMAVIGMLMIIFGHGGD